MNPDINTQSLIKITIDSIFAESEIARGHILFAQANLLCVALVHKPIVLTHESQVEFEKKAKLDDIARADAHVIDITDRHHIIEVNSYVSDMLVFKGKFEMYYTSEDR